MYERLNSSQYKLAVQRLGLKSGTTVYDDRGMYFCYRHKDTKPSLSIDFKKGIYHCFSCDDSGSINNLCYKMAGKGLKDVLGLSENEFNIFKPTQKYEAPLEKTENDSHIDIRGVVVPYRDSPEALQYLETRGISLPVADAMGMQYTEEATFNGKWYTKRLLIPIYGQDGHLVSVEGRDVTFSHPQKCLYPSDSIKSVYEWYKLDKTKPLYLFEGLIKMAVARSDDYFKNSTSIYGTGITSYQLSLLNLFEHVILVPDNDDAGKALITKLQKNLSVRFSTLQLVGSDLKDVDEIPTKKHMTVKEFREKGGFLAGSLVSLIF